MLKKPDLHTDRILKVADRIEKSEDFDMRSWETCACGHVWREMQENGLGFSVYGNCKASQASEYLGIDHIMGNTIWGGPSCSKEQAASLMRHLAITGEVDWNRVIKKSFLEKMADLVA